MWGCRLGLGLGCPVRLSDVRLMHAHLWVLPSPSCCCSCGPSVTPAAEDALSPDQSAPECPAWPRSVWGRGREPSVSVHRVGGSFAWSPSPAGGSGRGVRGFLDVGPSSSGTKEATALLPPGHDPPRLPTMPRSRSSTGSQLPSVPLPPQAPALPRLVCVGWQRWGGPLTPLSVFS